MKIKINYEKLGLFAAFIIIYSLLKLLIGFEYLVIVMLCSIMVDIQKN